jgi:S-formylglutathione hydrolase FrmB
MNSSNLREKLASRPKWPACSFAPVCGAPATQRSDHGKLSASGQPPCDHHKPVILREMTQLFLRAAFRRVGRRSRRISAALHFTIFAFYFALPIHAATGRVECNSLPSKILARAVPYCVVLPPSFDADKSRHFSILYFLHGLGDNEQFLIHSGLWNVVEDMRDRHELKDFLIATPDGGAGFYINSKDRKNRYGDFLIQEFFPFIEKRYRVSPGRANRAIDGVSMGGYGALLLGFRYPQLFASVSAHSAALIDKLASFATAATPPSPRTRIFGGVFGSPLDPAFWEQNSPITLARSANLAGLKIYFDCGEQDDYGFESGATALDKILTSRHIPHEFHLSPGRHDYSYFATHIPASLRFASNLFP